MPATSTQHAPAKPTGPAVKGGANKTVCKEMPMSPTAPPQGPVPPAPTADRAELLGSLTTQQQQRTSARVIKKLRLDDAAADKKDPLECDNTPKLLKEEEVKETLKLKTRMPKAIWMPEEKNLFFEALNEYGKDFDAITNYICAKMKRKGVPDAMLKTKNQVSHFYYRTWHKLSKHVHFDENVKKVAQELYALINYGELRKKLTSVNEKTCARLGEMVCCGSLAVRARGRSLRVRTPMCRALRRLNQITERAVGPRVCTRCLVVLQARDAGAWARVQAAAHNPRAAADLPLRARLHAFIHALERRWAGRRTTKNLPLVKKEEDELCTDSVLRARGAGDGTDDRPDDNHLNLQTERMIVQEHNLPRKLALHVGPGPNTTIHLPTLTASEQLSTQKICFASYLERMCRDPPPKIRTPKRTRKDSSTEKDKEVEHKKFKQEETEPKLMNIDETAIDGIELIASIKHHKEDDEKDDKPSTEDEKEIKSGDLTEEERDGHTDIAGADKDPMSEREKDSFSEMEDDEKYNESDIESDGKPDKARQETKFKNLKVKFRIRPKKRGGSIYTLVTDAPSKDTSEDSSKTIEDQTKTIEDIKVTVDNIKATEEKGIEDQTKISDEHKGDETEKADIDVEMATRQIRKGWSIYDAGQLTIGDLYLMFGSRSKLELDYWWAEPCLPLPQPAAHKPHKHHADLEKTPPMDREKDKAIDKKETKTPEKGTDSSLEDDKEKRESDNDIFSPKNTYSQDSNDGLSGDEKKNEQLLSPEHKFPTFPLASKLLNRPDRRDSQHGHLALISDRLKRLLALAGNPHIVASGAPTAAPKCSCGHVCQKKKTTEKVQQPPTTVPAPAPPTPEEANAQVFRHPTPIAPRIENEMAGPRQMSTEDLPRWRRGRPRVAEKRVVVQRLLPLLPKLPPAHNLIPVKLVSNAATQPPRIAPRPPPAPTPPASNETSHVYVLSEMNGQFFFHDGNRRIPLTAPPLPALSADSGAAKTDPQDKDTEEMEEYVLGLEPKTEVTSSVPDVSVSAASDVTVSAGQPDVAVQLQKDDQKPDSTDIASVVSVGGDVSMWSPGRLLAEGAWPEGAVQDFSLSSFLGHLEGRPHPDPAVDSQLHSLMAESSVDYVAKFADLAAEVTGETDPLVRDDLA